MQTSTVDAVDEVSQELNPAVAQNESKENLGEIKSNNSSTSDIASHDNNPDDKIVLDHNSTAEHAWAATLFPSKYILPTLPTEKQFWKKVSQKHSLGI